VRACAARAPARRERAGGGWRACCLRLSQRASRATWLGRPAVTGAGWPDPCAAFACVRAAIILVVWPGIAGRRGLRAWTGWD